MVSIQVEKLNLVVENQKEELKGLILARDGLRSDLEERRVDTTRLKSAFEMEKFENMNLYFGTNKVMKDLEKERIGKDEMMKRNSIYYEMMNELQNDVDEMMRIEKEMLGKERTYQKDEIQKVEVVERQDDEILFLKKKLNEILEINSTIVNKMNEEKNVLIQKLKQLE